MNILVSNNHLIATGGTETFVYTLVEQLLKEGHNVEYYCIERGDVSNRIEKELNIKFSTRKKYDLILANHNTTISKVYKKGFIIQTCHGIFSHLEQPTMYADGFVSISLEVQTKLLKEGFKSTIIYNGINCERYRPITELRSKNIRVLSLCHSEEAHKVVEDASKNLNYEFGRLDKYLDNVWNVEKFINEYDIVVGLGRSAYEAMACGRPVVFYDKRRYSSSYGDGYFLDVLPVSLNNNCSGRALKIDFDIEMLTVELAKYKPEHGDVARKIALNSFNIENSTKKYFQYFNLLKNQRRKIFKRYLKHYTPNMFKSIVKFIIPNTILSKLRK